MKTYTITELAKAFGLSRSTLLYYHRIGLLKAPERTDSGYRIYGEEERKRLERICLFRASGLALSEIQRVIDGDKPHQSAEILEARLKELEREMAELKRQQQITVSLVQQITGESPSQVVDKKVWTQMLEAAGMDEDAMATWHSEFEKRAPHAHHAFLLSIGISEAEASRIRAWSRKGKREEP